MTRALVTGATGMLGRSLVDLLLEAGFQVRVYARPSSDVSHLHGTPVEIVVGEAPQTDAIRQAVNGVDYVFHTAGYVDATAPFTTNNQSSDYKRANVDLTEQLLAASQAAGITRFVYASSASVYDIHASAPTTEDALLNPASIYGQSKLQAEKRVRAYQAQGLSTSIVRASVIYGQHDRHFMPVMRRLAKAPVLPLVNGGRNLLDLVYVRDVAEILLLASQSPRADGRVYNAGPGQPTSPAALISAYRDLTGRGPRILPVSERVARRAAVIVRPLVGLVAPALASYLSDTGLALISADIHLSMERTREELGYEPRYSLEEGLALTLESNQLSA